MSTAHRSLLRARCEMRAKRGENLDRVVLTVVGLHNTSTKSNGLVRMVLVTFGSKSNGKKDNERKSVR
jgi:hypothetical protein